MQEQSLQQFLLSFYPSLQVFFLQISSLPKEMLVLTVFAF